jgi:hypothetical protein
LASRSVDGRFFSSRSAITVLYEPSRLTNSAGASYSSKSASPHSGPFRCQPVERSHPPGRRMSGGASSLVSSRSRQQLLSG